MLQPSTLKGRPRNQGLTRRILRETLKALATRGYHGTSTQHIAEKTATSKQALYRRWETKEALALEALRYGFAQVPPVYPGMGSFQKDLAEAATNIQQALHETPLGKAWLALLAEPTLKEELSLIEGEQRTHLRQVFVYWNATASMESSIDQLMGFLFFTCLIRNRKPQSLEIIDIIQSVGKYS